MGIGTRSRRIIQTYDGVDANYGSPGLKIPRIWDILGPGVSAAKQVTTSYRTGRGGAGNVTIEDQEIDDLLSSKSYRERFQTLKRNAKTQKVTSPNDNGHEFKTTHSSVSYVSMINVTNGGPTWYTYRGPAWPYLGDGAVPNRTYVFAAAPDWGYYGPRAISATTPTNPTSDVATALAELYREGVPQRPGSITQRQSRGKSKNPSKAGGSEFLNVEFGWKPIIRDLRRTLDAVKRSGKIIDQHERNSGKPIRRRYTFPVEKTRTDYPEKLFCVLDTLSNSTGWRNAFVSGSLSGTLHESVETEREVSFSGAYTYYVPKRDESARGKAGEFEQKANLLLGTRITPETLWNVAPWSWLADWNLNIGENIGNAVKLQSDGLVLRYGYLMAKTTVRHTLTLVGPRLVGQTARPGYSIEFVTVTKERVRASPFGFGSDPAGFTSRQWAILAALGMTKGDKSLRLND